MGPELVMLIDRSWIRARGAPWDVRSRRNGIPRPMTCNRSEVAKSGTTSVRMEETPEDFGVEKNQPRTRLTVRRGRRVAIDRQTRGEAREPPETRAHRGAKVLSSAQTLDLSWSLADSFTTQSACGSRLAVLFTRSAWVLSQNF